MRIKKYARPAHTPITQMTMRAIPAFAPVLIPLELAPATADDEAELEDVA